MGKGKKKAKQGTSTPSGTPPPQLPGPSNPQQPSGHRQPQPQQPAGVTQQPQRPQQPGGPGQQRPQGPQQPWPQQQQPQGPQQPQPQQQPAGITQQPQRPQQPGGRGQQQPQGLQQPGGPWQQPQRPQQPGGPWQQPQRLPQPQQQAGGPWQQPQRPQQPGGSGQQGPQQPGGPWQQPQRLPQPQQQAGGPWQQPQRPQQPGGSGQQGPQQPGGPWQQPQRLPQPQQQAGGPWQQPQRPQQPGGPGQQGPQQHQPIQQPQQQQPQVPQQSQPKQQPRGPQQQQPKGPQEHQPKQQPQGPQQSQVAPGGGTQLAALSKHEKLDAKWKQYWLDQIPVRKNPLVCGTLGIKTTVETNMFKLNIGPNFRTDVTHYDVTITPDKPKYMMRPVFEAFRLKHFKNRYPAFDGKKNVFSAYDLPFTDVLSDTVSVFNHERQMETEFHVSLQKVAEIDLSWIRSLKPGYTKEADMEIGMQTLEVILRHGPASSLIPVGRSLFYPPGQYMKPWKLQNAMQVWSGTFMSAVAAWKPFVNIDVVHKAFPTSQRVIDTLAELCASGGGRDFGGGRGGRGDAPPPMPTFKSIMDNAKTVEQYLKGLKVQFQIPGRSDTKRTHRVNGLVRASARDDKFTCEGKPYTVEKYFAEKKGYRLQYPDLPCLWVGPKDKQIHVPPEFCLIVEGQPVQRKTDPQQTAQMIRYTATSTQVRKEKIMNAFKAARINEHPTVKNEFNLSVNPELAQVPARILNPPLLKYDQNMQVKVFKGTWRAGKFVAAMHVQDDKWTVVCLDDYKKESDLHFLCERLQQAGVSNGMRIGKPLTPFRTISFRKPDAKHQLMKLFQELKEKQLELVIVILPKFPDNAYSIVKQCSELRTALLTQCLKGDTLSKLSESTLGNILQKVNSKLNGINHIIHPGATPSCLDDRCILFGADVTHPTPDAIDIPSVAAVVASHDAKAFQYNVQVRLQPPKVEIIEDLEAITVKQLDFYRKKTGKIPQKIIFYRDGVSEGQLPQVMHYEIGAMRRAFKSLSSTYNPKITYFVVQKRHHIRLFPTSEKDSDDAHKNFNVKAGTIVDTEITHPSHIDFYLVSHASIQGTARPTKYRCLLNEINLTENEIEELTYYLCHLFARCTRSVSYPAPTYYAHLAAYRGKAYIQSQTIRMDRLADEQQEKMPTNILSVNPMYFV